MSYFPTAHTLRYLPYFARPQEIKVPSLTEWKRLDIAFVNELIHSTEHEEKKFRK